MERDIEECIRKGRFDSVCDLFTVHSSMQVMVSAQDLLTELVKGLAGGERK